MTASEMHEARHIAARAAGWRRRAPARRARSRRAPFGHHPRVRARHRSGRVAPGHAGGSGRPSGRSILDIDMRFRAATRSTPVSAAAQVDGALGNSPALVIDRIGAAGPKRSGSLSRRAGRLAPKQALACDGARARDNRPHRRPARPARIRRGVNNGMDRFFFFFWGGRPPLFFYLGAWGGGAGTVAQPRLCHFGTGSAGASGEGVRRGDEQKARPCVRIPLAI